CRRESRSRLFLIMLHAGDDAFHNRTMKVNAVVDQRYAIDDLHRLARRSGVALCQRATQPIIGHVQQHAWVLSANGIYSLTQWLSIRFPVELDRCECDFRIRVVRLYGQRALEDGLFLRVAPENSVTESNLLERLDIVGVEVTCALQILY